jgi:hypothetical protein
VYVRWAGVLAARDLEGTLIELFDPRLNNKDEHRNGFSDDELIPDDLLIRACRGRPSDGSADPPAPVVPVQYPCSESLLETLSLVTKPRAKTVCNDDMEIPILRVSVTEFVSVTPASRSV